MTLIQREICFADALTDEGVDYGTGYWVIQYYSDGETDMFGPYDYEEDARALTALNY